MAKESGRRHDPDEFDVEGKILARQGMIAVERNCRVVHRRHREQERLVVGCCRLQLAADGQVYFLRDHRPVNSLDRIGLMRAIGVLRVDLDGGFVANRHADDGLFEMRDDGVFANFKFKRGFSVGKIEYRPVIELAAIVNLDGIAGIGLRHELSPSVLSPIRHSPSGDMSK